MFLFLFSCVSNELDESSKFSYGSSAQNISLENEDQKVILEAYSAWLKQEKKQNNENNYEKFSKLYNQLHMYYDYLLYNMLPDTDVNDEAFLFKVTDVSEYTDEQIEKRVQQLKDLEKEKFVAERKVDAEWKGEQYAFIKNTYLFDTERANATLHPIVKRKKYSAKDFFTDIGKGFVAGLNYMRDPKGENPDGKISGTDIMMTTVDIGTRMAVQKYVKEQRITKNKEIKMANTNKRLSDLNAVENASLELGNNIITETKV